MSNVLIEEKRQQVLALGRLGWSLRRIEGATGVRRETASSYLKAAGLTVRGRGRRSSRPAKPAISSEVSTDSSRVPSAGTGTGDAAPASGDRPSRAPQASACEPYRELIAEAVGRVRNAMAIWQDWSTTMVSRLVMQAAHRRGAGRHHHRPKCASTSRYSGLRMGVVDVGHEDALLEVVEHDDADGAARRNTRSCSSAQTWALDRPTSRRTDLRE